MWVFGLFFALLGFGYFQSKRRVSSRNRVAILPVAMIMLSLSGVLSVFGVSAIGIAAWSIGVGLAVLLNQLLALPRGVRFSAPTQSFEVPGSWLPLILMMAIFFIKYAVAVALVRSPLLVDKLLFVGGVSTMYGLLSGLFFARLLRIWRVAKERPASAA